MSKINEYDAGERLYISKSSVYDRVLKEHLARYEFAKKYIDKKYVVLDAACGSGYGSSILAGYALKVIGLEINDHALSFARTNYNKENLEFRKADLNSRLDFPDNHFDLVTSFETIEHIEDQSLFLSELRRVLRPGGIILISSPDREVINNGDITANKFHINELSKEEFITTAQKFFKTKEIFGQVRFSETPWYIKLIKMFTRLDFLHLRRKFAKLPVVRLIVNKYLLSSADVEVEKTDFQSEDRFHILLLLCEK